MKTLGHLYESQNGTNIRLYTNPYRLECGWSILRQP
jgi:hypothetical protein